MERDFFVVVQVNADEALALAEALSDGKVDIVRSRVPSQRVWATDSPGERRGMVGGELGEGAGPATAQS